MSKPKTIAKNRDVFVDDIFRSASTCAEYIDDEPVRYGDDTPISGTVMRYGINKAWAELFHGTKNAKLRDHGNGRYTVDIEPGHYFEFETGK